MRDSLSTRRGLKAHSIALGALVACCWPAALPAAEDDAYINVRVWDTFHNPRFFPERDDPSLKLPRLAGPGDTFGIAFSGGGTRSAGAILGQLKALKDLGWLKKAHYVTAVSGGSWVLIPFVFLPDSYCRRVRPQDCDDAFLGDYVPPERIDDAALAAKSKYSFARDIYQSSIVLRYVRRLFTRGDETYSSVIGRNFLERYGLNGKRWFAQRELIQKVVASSGKTRDDFYVTAAGRPFLIVSAALLARRRSAMWFDKHLLEITSMYAGIRVRDDAVLDDSGHAWIVGGGYLEPFGYDSIPPCAVPRGTCAMFKHGGLVRVRIGDRRYRFTLRDVVGVSSAGPADATARHGYDTFGLPEFKYWPIDTADEVLQYNEFRHGDGGHIDNTGLLPLLMRQVDNILVFKNSKRAFCTESMIHDHFERCASDEAPYEIHDEHLKRFFLERRDPGALVDEFAIFDVRLLQRMQDEFKERKLACEHDYRSPSCRPLVFCAKHHVRANARYGVMAVKNGQPYEPNICWFYLDRDKGWIGTIRNQSPQTDTGGAVQDLLQRKGAFERFPHYRTFLENTKPFPRSLRLKRSQVNAIRHLTAWTLRRSADEIASALGIQ